MSFDFHSELPAPLAAAASVSAELRARIHAEISRQSGSIPFDVFMRMALYEPGLGYYAAGAAKLGAVGDFVTAPEISALFGRCLAKQIAAVLTELNGGDVLEFGAGSGRLAIDVLTELDRTGCLPNRYLILEVSADLRERQRALLNAQLPHLVALVHWLDRMPEPPLHGVVIANEVLDAMPVARVRKHAPGEWMGLCVASAEQGFAWTERAIADDAPLRRALADIESECGMLPVGYITELNPVLAGWFAALAGAVEAGAVLLVDYGYARAEYYHPERRDGTLLCHYRHRAHPDPFIYVGLQDITASVDFTAVAEAAHENGFDVIGYLTQARFLLELGITEALQAMMTGDMAADLRLSQQVKRLLLPGEMGERFKVLVLGRGMANVPFKALAAGNDLHRL